MTPQQANALAFIRDFIAAKGWSPSYDEIQNALGLNSKAGVHRLIVALEAAGKITRRQYASRSLEVADIPGASRLEMARKIAKAMVEEIVKSVAFDTDPEDPPLFIATREELDACAARVLAAL